jgi:hypothetical protein
MFLGWLPSGSLVVLIGLGCSVLAQDEGTSKSKSAQSGTPGAQSGTSGAKSSASGTQSGATGAAKAGDSKKAASGGETAKGGSGKGAATAEADAPADPSKSTKVAPIEIFRDPRAEKLLDVKKFTAVPARAVDQGDVKELEAMARNLNQNPDTALMNRVVDAMAAQLTDHANIQALIDPPPKMSPNDPKSKAIDEARKALTEPLFSARNSSNQQFLAAYNRVLLQRLRPLLKNHLIPRTQASIVLGQSGNPDALPLFLEQIKDEKQTIWVKLWAMEGIANILRAGSRLTATNRIEAGKAIADFLKNEDDIPWPAQLRAAEALGVLRQGFRVNAPRDAEMATAAMRLLTDYQAKPEVRAEAARALGLMEITSAVPGYNYPLIAHAVGQLAAGLGKEIGSSFQNNPVKSRSLTVMLAGPVYQAFDGVQGMRDSGIAHMSGGDSYVSGVFDQIKPIVQVSSELLVSAKGQVPGRQKDLAAKVAALKEFLSKNPPKSRSLVRGGPEFPAGDAPAPGLPGG